MAHKMIPMLLHYESVELKIKILFQNLLLFYINVYININKYVCMYVCMYVYIYINDYCHPASINVALLTTSE